MVVVVMAALSCSDGGRWVVHGSSIGSGKGSGGGVVVAHGHSVISSFLQFLSSRGILDFDVVDTN